MPFPVAHSDATAILAPGRSDLSYEALKQFVALTRNRLREAGLSREDRVVLVTPNGPEAATGFLAIASACQCAPLNPGYREAELAFFLQDLQPRLVVHADELSAAVAAKLGIATARMRVDPAAPAGVFELPDLPPANGHADVDTPLGTALLLHTSGTTSRPKLVPLSWANLQESARNISRTLGLTPHDRCLNVMPLFHIHGLIAAVLSTLKAGGSVICTPGMIAPSFFDWMDEFAPTWYTAVPTMHQSILARAAQHAGSIGRSRLRFARSSSAPLPVTVLRELESTFNVPVVEAYGMTEAAHQMASNPLPPGVRKPGSVGPAAGPEIAVLDPSGQPAAIGDEGDVCIRGANVTTGYLENPQANQESFRSGWFYTGDLGRMDEDRYLYLTGRSKEILNRGGEKISPLEIDEVLMEHPAVRQCLTFALPDSQLGEEVGAIVVRRTGTIVEETELQNFVAARLADFKVPRRVFFLDEIPAGPTGKLQRIGLAQRLGITEDAWKPAQDATAATDSALASQVALIMAGVLGLSQLDPQTSFFDAGGDSLLAARLLVRLDREFGKTLTMVDLFRASSPAAIAARLPALEAQAAETLPAAITESVDGTPTLSAGQVRLWFHDQYEDDSLAAQSPRLYQIRGAVNPEHLRSALVRIVERHEPLRTIIRTDGGAPRGELRPVEPLPWEIYDWTATPPSMREASAREICLREAARPFRLDSDLMLRASLHKLDTERWWLLVTMHHAATDGWSAQVFRQELQACLDGETLPRLPIAYSAFSRSQEAVLTGERLASLREYWATQLQDLPPLLELPLEFPRPALQTYRGKMVSSVLPTALAATLRELGRKRQATLFMTLLAGWKCLLARYSGATDICIGTPVAGRGKVEFESLIGLFMNILVLRTRLAGDPTFSEALERVRDTSLGAWDHGDLPFERLLEALPPERSLAYSPYFQVFFQLRNFPRAPVSAARPVEELEFDLEAVLTDLNLEVTETGEGLLCRLFYNTSLFTERYARSMLGHLEVLLRGAVAAPDTKLSRLPLLAEEERAMLTSGRLPAQRLRGESTVVELFEQQVRERGHETAVLYRGHGVTYGELNRQANQLARQLVTSGVGPERIVALGMDRSPGWIVAMLAVAKAGGAYMPLEPDYPAARLRELIEIGRPVLVVADDRCRDTLQGTPVTVLWTAEWRARLAGEDEANLSLAAKPANLAHVFFTSGSTGRPKAVATEHRHLSAFLAGYHWMPFSPSETCLQFTSVTFDPSAAEVWGPLTSGGRCAIHGEGLDEPARLGEWIRDAGVTMCFLSSSVFNTLIDVAPEVLRPVRRILIGGEALSVPHIRRGLELLPRTELINGYGPTETTIYLTAYRIPRVWDAATSSIPIGRPLDNSGVFVMDRDGELVPDGLPGELWIAGDTVGRGYLHDDCLSGAAFLPSPIAVEGMSRVYRTGDRARWLPNGEIEFLGRLDHQVKVRGVRIELGEIEAVLREQPGVRHAAVVAASHPTAGTTLVGFVELRDDASETAAILLRHLAARLPAQMVPVRLEVRAALPMNANGKIDRQALKASAVQEPQPAERIAAEPADLQGQLAEIWRALLGVREVKADDSFFALGGHSLLAARLAFEIERRFGRRLTLVSLFESATLSRMARLIGNVAAARPDGIIAAPAPHAALPPMLCVGAGPLFHPLAEALSPRCEFQSIATPYLPELSAPVTMETLAARVVPVILASYPHGPVMLAGWSLAGVVAIEVAVQLEAAGRDVPVVILFDTVSPVRQRQWFAPAPRLRQWQLNLIKARYHLQDALALGPAQALTSLMGSFRDARARLQYDRILRESTAGGTGHFDVPLDFKQSYGPYAASYSPAPLRGRVIVVRPERQKRGAFFGGDLGWSELGYRVDLLIVPGDHERMFAVPNAALLAARLLEHLDA